MLKMLKKTVKSGLDRLIISVDGTTQDTYEQYRIGGQLSQVLEGQKIWLKPKKAKSSTPHLVFSFGGQTQRTPNRWNLSVGPRNWGRWSKTQIGPGLWLCWRQCPHPHPLTNMPDIGCCPMVAGMLNIPWSMPAGKCGTHAWSPGMAWWCPAVSTKMPAIDWEIPKRSPLNKSGKELPIKISGKNCCSAGKEIDICTNCTEGCNVFFDHG